MAGCLRVATCNTLLLLLICSMRIHEHSLVSWVQTPVFQSGGSEMHGVELALALMARSFRAGLRGESHLFMLPRF